MPIIVNDLEEPMPSIHRCLAWGRVLRKAIESYPEPLRVAILGTGGLSHSIGETTMGWIDEEFDHACIKHFQDGEETRLAAFLSERLPRTGNGAHEIRDWVVAHAAAGSTGFELIDYFPSPETLVGAGFASWKVAQALMRAAASSAQPEASDHGETDRTRRDRDRRRQGHRPALFARARR